MEDILLKINGNLDDYDVLKECFLNDPELVLECVGKKIDKMVSSYDADFLSVQIYFSYYSRLILASRTLFEVDRVKGLIKHALIDLDLIKALTFNSHDRDIEYIHLIVCNKIKEIIAMRDEIGRNHSYCKKSNVMTFAGNENLNFDLCLLLEEFVNSSVERRSELKKEIITFLENNKDDNVVLNKIHYIKYLLYHKNNNDMYIDDIINCFKSTRHELTNKYGILLSHSKGAIDEVYAHKFNDYYREDLRDLNFLTIDGANAAEIDDAIAVVKNSDGTYTKYVAISDVANLIDYDSISNLSAYSKGETLYLYDRIAPMLHEYISKYLCSLLPNNCRYAICYEIRYDKNFNIIDSDDNAKLKIIPGKIMVRNKLTYDESNNLLLSDKDNAVVRDLRMLLKISEKFYMKNKSVEAYRDKQNKTRELVGDAVNYDFESKYIGMLSTKIIEESMVLINCLSAEYFSYNKIPYIYRGHKYNDYDCDKNIDDTIRKYMARAFYTDKPVPHVGLGLSCYSHSTAPLRRYVDLFNQYLIHSFVFNEDVSYSFREDILDLINELANNINGIRENNLYFQSEYNFFTQNRLIRKRVK